MKNKFVWISHHLFTHNALFWIHQTTRLFCGNIWVKTKNISFFFEARMFHFFAFPRIEHIWKFSIQRVGWGKWVWIGRILVENIPVIYALILWLRSETFWLQKRERFLVFTQMLQQNNLVVWWVQNNTLWVNKWCKFQTNLFFN